MKKELIILLSIAGLTAMSFGNDAEAQETVYASSLYNYSSGNEAAFDARYTGKTFKVKGAVDGSVVKCTDSWNAGKYSLWISTGGNYYYYSSDNSYSYSGKQQVQLFFTASNAGQLANLRAADEITVSGRGIGRGGSLVLQYKYGRRPYEPYMDNCTLIQRGKLGATIAKEEWAVKKKARDEEDARKEAERLVWEKEQEERRRKEREAEEQAEREAAERKAEERRRNGVVEGYISVGGSPATGGHPVTFKLDWTTDPKPSYSGGQEEGQVVIKIVLRQGVVKKATIVESQTTITGSAIRTSALNAAKSERMRWKESYDDEDAMIGRFGGESRNIFGFYVPRDEEYIVTYKFSR
jgi:hypothetical protein